ncbi:MAG: hypothetical protein ACYDB7_14860, partial [Mycobacteriales bacterium]
MTRPATSAPTPGPFAGLRLLLDFCWALADASLRLLFNICSHPLRGAGRSLRSAPVPSLAGAGWSCRRCAERRV